MFDWFRDHSPPHFRPRTEARWEMLVVAQHHGLPTRLLDWTENPLAALWFAVHEPACNDEDGVVWVYRYSKSDLAQLDQHLDPFKVCRTRILRPAHVTQRIVSQFGWFTLHPFNAQGGGFVPLEKAVPSELTKLVIPANAFSDLRWQLDRCGVNCASLFNDLDGLCKHIQWRHTYLEDEEDGRSTSNEATEPPGNRA